MKTIQHMKILAAGLAATLISGCVTEVQSDPNSSAGVAAAPAATIDTQPDASPAPAPVQDLDASAPSPATDDSSSAPIPAQISPGASEIVKLSEAGTGDDVMESYIQNAQGTFDLSADGIIYLKDLGVSSTVISAMINHDTALRSQNPNVGEFIPNSVTEPVPVATAPIEVAAPAPGDYESAPPAQVNYFYDQLRPYGTWVVLPGYGWCWQPSTIVVRRDWTPYSDGGHWVWTDAGWFWQSDYSWGWAPFHYGRWYRDDRCGWVWTPDTVWAPAWVTWRTSGDYCGWAPLPPHADFDARVGYRFNGLAVRADFDFGLRPDHFTFVAFKDFSDHDFAHRRLAQPQVTQIYKQTTVINNYTINNTTVVNRGIPVDRVAAATHTQFKTVAIRDTPSEHVGKPAGPGKTDTVVYRPELKMPAKPPVHAVAQKLDPQHPVVSHTEVRAVTVDHKPLTNPALATTRGGQGQSRPTVQTPTRPTPQPRQPEVTSTTPRQPGRQPNKKASPQTSNPGNQTVHATSPVTEPGKTTVETSARPVTQARQPQVTPTTARPEVTTQGNAPQPNNVATKPVVTPQRSEPVRQTVSTPQHQPTTLPQNVRSQERPVAQVPRTEPAPPPRSTAVASTARTPTYTPPRTEETFRSNNNRAPNGASQHVAEPATPTRNSTPEPPQNTHVYYPKGHEQAGAGKSGSPMYQGVNPTMKGQKPQ